MAIRKFLEDVYSKYIIEPWLANHPLHEYKVKGIERAALFDQKADHEIVTKTFNLIGNRWNYDLADRNKILIDYENNLERIHNDQRTGTKFYNGKKFEPHEVCIIHNLVTNPGVSEITQILSLNSTEFARYYAVGTGLSDTNLAQERLDREVQRQFVFGPGGYSQGHGNTWKIGCEFDTAIRTAKLTEFGAFSQPSEGIMYARAVIQDPTQWLNHVSTVTFPAASHTIMFRPV